MVGVDILRGHKLGTQRGLADSGGSDDEDADQVSLVPRELEQARAAAPAVGGQGRGPEARGVSPVTVTPRARAALTRTGLRGHGPGAAT